MPRPYPLGNVSGGDEASEIIENGGMNYSHISHLH